MSSRLLSVLSVSLILAFTGCSKAPEPVADVLSPTVAGELITFPDKSPQRAALTVVAVESETAERHRLTGRLTWNEDSTVRVYSPVAGRVQSLAVSLGDTVEKDSALARINSPDLGQAQADYHKAAADLQFAERTFNRAKDLIQHGALAQKDVESAEDIFSTAKSELQRTTARMALYGIAPENGDVDGAFLLRAPLAGVVVDKSINVGQEVRPDQMLANVPQLAAPLFIISNPLRLSVVLDATEQDLAVLRPGMSFAIRTSAAPDRVFEGRVEWVSDALDPATRRITVRGSVENPDRLLKAEMFVTVEFESAPAAAALAVPSTAVIMKSAKHFAFVEDKSGQFERREIEVGSEQDGKIVVRHGLEIGQRVVTDGSVLLEELHNGG